VTQVIAAATAFPPHRYEQAEITRAVAEMLAVRGQRRDLLERFHAASGVEARHLVLPLADYQALDGFGAANDAFLRFAVAQGADATRRALAMAGLGPADVDVVMTVSVTGIGAPSVDARLVAELGLRQDVRRVPVFGLGCVAGAAGVARLHDMLAGDDRAVGVLVAAEACSLTVQRDDDSPANLVASALFGDGVAAVVLAGDARAGELGLGGPSVIATRSRLYPDTERVMGWDIGGSGFRIVLAASVADVVKEHLGDDVTEFLSTHGLTVGDVASWVAHPGGPKVIDAMASVLGLADGELGGARRSLAEVGNLSSASVLDVLSRTLADPPPAGSPGLMLAMGPGFCSELVLLRWPE
jgi:alkylresorcinol/alkylpyrone synthase